MHVQVLASGSAGNSMLVRAGELHLLLDAGLPLDALEGRLRDARVATSRLDAIVLTHGHLDHARAAGKLARKSGATVICCERLMKNRSLRSAPRLRTLPVGSPIEVTGRRGSDRAEVLAVAVPHDADPTVALRVEHEGRIACLVTDMGSPSPEPLRRLGDAHLVVLEFNHDEERLARGPYSDALKRRIAGPRGHLSNRQAAEALTRLVNPELHTVVLAHLSRENNTPELALGAAARVLEEAGRGDVRRLVAEQGAIGERLRV